MKRFSKNTLGLALFALAASVVSVGLVWAGSSALRDGDPSTRRVGDDNAVGAVTTVRDRVGTTSVSAASPAATSPATALPGNVVPGSVSPDDGDGDLPRIPPDGDPDIAELARLVRALSDQVENLAATIAASNDKIDALEKKVTTVSDDFDGLEARLSKGLTAIEDVGDDVAQAKRDAADALDDVSEMKTTVSLLERKADNLDEEGTYSGPVNPSQFTRKLTTADISGNWPLDRVSDKLRIENLEVHGSGCWSDYRYHTVLVANPFRGLDCVRLAK